MFKKSILMVLALLPMLFLCACSNASYTKEKWVFSELVSVDVYEEIDEELLQMYLEYNGAANVNELESILLNNGKNEGTFNDFYLFFEGKFAHYFDENLERETTYFFKEFDGEVILALGEMQFEDPSIEENLDPVICPRFVVSEDGKELTFTYYYIYYFVTIKCVAE